MDSKILVPHVILLCILAWLHPRDARGHAVEGSNLQLLAELSEEQLIFDISAETSLVPPLDTIRFGAASFPTADEIKDSLVRYFAEHCPVLIDGIVVTPVLEDIQFEPMENQVNLGAVSNFVMAYFLLHYPVKTKPKTVDITWDIFLPDHVNEIVPDTPDPTGHTPQTVDSIFFTYGDLDLMTLTPEEPNYIWHTPDPILSVDAQRRLELASDAAATREPREFSLAWPLASLLLLGALLTGWKRRLPLALGCTIASLAVAAAYRPLTIHLKPPAESLTESEAMQRFQDLHQNIYRAFDYDTDEAIYDTLAQSVSGDLLDEIYRNVYTSLVMKDEGGAVCRVKRLEYLDCQPAPLDPDQSGFAFDTHWRVHGLVQHWGHTHERVNEYQARYQLSQTNGLWMIAAVDISQEKRLNLREIENAK